MTAETALQKLIAGNKRFCSGNPEHPNQNYKTRQEVTNGQKPFAIILSCSDSRVVPEILFDQGIGDLFVIRVAGNIVDNLILGSIEYAADHCEVPLLVVLGHSDCGAVTATLEAEGSDSHTDSILKEIQPAVQAARNQEGDLLTNAVLANVDRVVRQLRKSEPILPYLVRQGKLTIMGAYYDLETGAVDYFDFPEKQ